MKRISIAILAACMILSGCRHIPWSRVPDEITLPVPQPKPPPEPPPLSQQDPDPSWQWIYGRNISHWPVTMNLSDVVVHYGGREVDVVYDRLQEIPAWNVPGDPNNVHNVNGSIWLVREFQGQWYIGTFEYLRVGQQRKEFVWPAPQWQFDPQPGDRIGFMVSTMARHREDGTISGGRVYRERSNIRWLAGDWSPP